MCLKKKKLQPSPPYESYFLQPHYFEADPLSYEGLLWKVKNNYTFTGNGRLLRTQSVYKTIKTISRHINRM